MTDDDDYQHVVCRGGGRISIDNDHIKIYGFSYAFGKADHQDSADIIRASYPEFNNLIWNVDEWDSYIWTLKSKKLNQKNKQKNKYL